MKKFALIAAVISAIVLPASSSDAKPKDHNTHDGPVVARIIDWD